MQEDKPIDRLKIESSPSPLPRYYRCPHYRAALYVEVKGYSVCVTQGSSWQCAVVQTAHSCHRPTWTSGSMLCSHQSSGRVIGRS